MNKSLLTIFGLSANLFLIGCADDQARQQIADTNQRLSQIQQNLGLLDNKISNQKMLDLLNQVDELQNQISQLNGRVSTLEQGQSSGQGDQSQQLQALDLRLSALESSLNGAPAMQRSTSAAGAKVPAINNPQLQSAIKKIQANKLTAAIDELKPLIEGPDKAVAINSRYFLAVAYLANGENPEAITAANKFIAMSPNNKYVPDALRVIYIAQSQQNNTAAANATARRLQKSFPQSQAARKVAAAQAQ
jgi:TolA-binding protein